MDNLSGINLIKKIEAIVNDPLNNQYLSTGLLVLIVLYSGMLSTKLSNPVVPLLKSGLVKILLGIVIVLTFKKNTAISLITLTALVLSIQTTKKINAATKISEVITENNQINITENILLKEQIEVIVNEENLKPENVRLSSEEIIQVAEERVQNIMMEQTRAPESEIVANEVKQQYSEAIPEENVVEENVVEENVIEENVVEEEIINRSLPAISRVIVEEELKKEAVLPEISEPTKISGFDKSNITEETLASVSEIVPIEEVPVTKVKSQMPGFDKSSPLEEQIQKIQGTQITNNNTRSSRGLKVNKKCNLCTLKKPEQNMDNVTAYGGNSLASY